MITIKHLTGPLSGQEAQFGDDRERIVIGRDPSLCDVVFPPDYTKVGREHLALLRELSGDYAIEPFGDHYVEVDGIPATPQSSVPANATIRLGLLDGPTFQLSVDRSKTSDAFPRTQDQEKVIPERVVSGRARQFALGALVLAVLVAAGLGIFAYETDIESKREQHLAEELSRQLVVLAQSEKARAGEAISVADRERLARSVFAVIQQDSNGGENLLGTAWAVRPNLLATNAHVAAEFTALKSGESLIVRPAGSGDYRYRVDGVQIHPGYDAYESYTQSDPFFVTVFGGSTRLKTIPGYDVALLHVRTALPGSLILTIEDPDKIANLAPGDPVALAGYSYENLVGDEVQPLGRTPQVQVGNITSLSDLFLLPAEPAQRHLVQHNLPITGGASGSPVIDSNGRVVAIASGGNVMSLDGKRIPNAALVNYAQRADALADLLAGAADARLEADRSYWTQKTSVFKRGVDVIIPFILNKVGPGGASKAVLVQEYDSSATPERVVENTNSNGETTSFRARMFPVSLKSDSKHIFVAYAKNTDPIAGMLLAVDGQVVVRADISGEQFVAYFSYSAPAVEQSATLVVATPDNASSYIVRDYVWETATP